MFLVRIDPQPVLILVNTSASPDVAEELARQFLQKKIEETKFKICFADKAEAQVTKIPDIKSESAEVCKIIE